MNYLANEIFNSDKDPFLIWKNGMNENSELKFSDSATRFKDAAQAFYNLASIENELARAYYEYSTLMDAYEHIQLGRQQLSENQFDEGLESFKKACEILRSTIHFGFLSPFVSACASAEVSSMMEKDDPDCLQGFRNSIALFEQSKMALSFQDEIHPMMTLIEADIRYCISQVLLIEASELKRKNEPAYLYLEKENRSHLVMEEFELLAKKADLGTQGMCYLPVRDYIRAKEGAFIRSYPDPSGLWLLNLGTNPVEVVSVGDLPSFGGNLDPKKSMRLDPKVLKGKIRIVYDDTVTKKRFDEGCLLVI